MTDAGVRGESLSARPSSEPETLRPLGPTFYTSVRNRLRARAETAEVAGLLLLAPGNVRYATGWHFSVNERDIDTPKGARLVAEVI